jgi:DNA helicase-2/ATP-dependent DNA helicase PcrA
MLFQQMIQIFINDSKTMHVDDLGEKIVNITGMAKDLYNSHNPDDIARRENIEELLAGMTMFVDEQTEQGLGDAVFVYDYLQQVALLTDLDSDKDDTEKVKLMTIHAAKGLEFSVVFVVGLEENLFPSVMSIDTKKNIEEERRLLYVAITRAEKYCFLTNAKNRVRYGKMEFNSPSRFLHDIDQRLLVCAGKRMDGDNGRKSLRNSNDIRNRRIQNSRPVASQFMADEKPKITHGSIPEEAVNPFSDDFMNMLRQRGADTQRIEQNITKGGRMITPKPSDTPIITTAPSRSNNDYDSPTLSEGDTIEHQRFGRGTVISIEGMGENTKATVDFRNVGTKQLLLRFAKYRKV